MLTIYVIVTLIIIILLLILNIPSSISFIQINSISNRTVFECIKHRSISVVSLISTAVLRFFIPFILLNYFNFITAKVLINRKRIINANINDEKDLIYKFLFFDIVLLNFPLACLQIIIAFNLEFNHDLKVTYEYVRIIAWSFYFILGTMGIIFNKFEREYIFKLLRKCLIRKPN